MLRAVLCKVLASSLGVDHLAELARREERAFVVDDYLFEVRAKSAEASTPTGHHPLERRSVQALGLLRELLEVWDGKDEILVVGDTAFPGCYGSITTRRWSKCCGAEQHAGDRERNRRHRRQTL